MSFHAIGAHTLSPPQRAIFGPGDWVWTPFESTMAAVFAGLGQEMSSGRIRQLLAKLATK
jgi:hypothetical protein